MHALKLTNSMLFLSTLSLRRATRVSETLEPRQYQFLSTLSLRRATTVPRGRHIVNTNFYPRSPCGERQAANSLADTPPQISIHALLAESDSHQACSGNQQPAISIHALLAESDGVFNLFANPGSTISIHALLAESDLQLKPPIQAHRQFLSTLSLRRATSSFRFLWCRFCDFYPRSPCGERRDVIAVMTEAQSISIHALLAESDASAGRL